METKPIAQLVGKALAEVRELPTKDEPMTTPALLQKRYPKLAEFNTFGEPSLVAAKRETETFIRSIKTGLQPYALSLLGNSGTGKTMLSKIVMGELRVNGWGCIESVAERIEGGKFIRATASFRDWRRVSDKIKSGEYDIIDALEEPFLLVLDDVGSDYDPSKMVASKLDRLIRSRRGKWTFITCNLLLHQVAEGLDPRIASFMIRDGNKVVEINSTDFSLR